MLLKSLDWSVCICLTQLYDGRDMYRIYYVNVYYAAAALDNANCGTSL